MISILNRNNGTEGQYAWVSEEQKISWRHLDTEKLPALLALCAKNPTFSDVFPNEEPVLRRIYVFTLADEQIIVLLVIRATITFM